MLQAAAGTIWSAGPVGENDGNMEFELIKNAVEAILFAAGDSVEAGRIAQVLGVETAQILQAAEILQQEYANRGIRLVRMENKLQIVSAPEFSDDINHALEKRAQNRLSPTALEVLSIVAYFQPVTRAYIEQLRGADSSYTVAMLSERGLIEPCGKLEAPGRPTLFATTERFLRVMGITSLEELPPLPDVATGEGMQELQAAIDAAQNDDIIDLILSRTYFY